MRLLSFSSTLQILFWGASVACTTAMMSAQSAQKIAEIACAQESRQRGESLWSTRTVEHVEQHTLEYRRLETVDGEVQKLVSVDGHAPDGPEKLKNDGILHALLTDPAARKKAADTAHADTVRMQETLSMIPAMFTFQDKSNDGVTRVLSFAPNPSYKPKTYEERAIHSLVGEVKIDVKTTRIEALDATVSEPVKFGYGIVGSLSQGGTIHIRSVEVAPGIWKIHEEKLNLDGHIALVKNMSKKEDTERSDYKRLPNDCTIMRALDMLQVTQ